MKTVEQAVAGSQLIVLATPLPATEDVLRSLGSVLSDDVVVTDTCPLKTPVLAWADAYLGPSVAFVGGHPIIPSEGTGDVSSMDGVTYCVTPTENTKPQALDLVLDFIAAIGAQPFFLDAAEHDSYAVANHYLPRLAASATVSAVVQSDSWTDIRRLVESDFIAATAVGDIDPEELALVFHYAQVGAIAWIDRLLGQLGNLRAFAQSQEDTEAGLASLLRDKQSRLTYDPAQAGPSFERQSMSELFLGDWASRRWRPRSES
jgi:prephenate dehydrogenase